MVFFVCICTTHCVYASVWVARQESLWYDMLNILVFRIAIMQDYNLRNTVYIYDLCRLMFLRVSESLNPVFYNLCSRYIYKTRFHAYWRRLLMWLTPSFETRRRGDIQTHGWLHLQITRLFDHIRNQLDQRKIKATGRLAQSSPNHSPQRCIAMNFHRWGDINHVTHSQEMEQASFVQMLYSSYVLVDVYMFSNIALTYCEFLHLFQLHQCGNGKIPEKLVPMQNRTSGVIVCWRMHHRNMESILLYLETYHK